jgi:hypothetical protein
LVVESKKKILERGDITIDTRNIFVWNEQAYLKDNETDTTARTETST